ncbi:ferredoxin [Rhodococcus wratislaviensis]|uniref:ferredoxin n=1 Tax=Rhodococcus wratislaviensis TaxID=44752 RepID=UPI0009DCFD5D
MNSNTDSEIWVGVDSRRCSGHARCNVVSPEIFTLDDEGYSDIGERRPIPTDLREIARRGVASCPEQALRTF